MRLIFFLAFFTSACTAGAVSIDAIYFGQTHMHKPDNPYFGTVGDRDVFIKAHVTDPATPASPSVFATLSLDGDNLTIQLTGPATLPASIPDGLGVVQHSYANSFTGIIPAAWVKKGLQVTVNVGAVTSTVTNMKVSAPTKVIMTMTDVEYFANTTGDYPAGTMAELEAKWPVTDLEVRRLNNVVFRELVIPPRSDVSAQAVRIKSKAEYQGQTGLSFDGEQAAALEWNGALKRAAGRSGRWSLYYLNVYGAFAGGQAGGFAGVGSGTDIGILHHELGHAMSLPHWGDNGSYPYKGAMHGINPPGGVYNQTHAGPAWAFHQPTNAFIPPTVQPGNVGGKAAGTYKVDPMQGGGEGYQEPAYLMNHFSDYSVNQMRSYLNSHVVVWNPALNSGNGSWAQYNSTTGDYTTVVTNNGVQFPQQRDVQVISVIASVSGRKPSINMVYPPVGPYMAGLIRLFDPTVAADRTAAQSIFAPTSGCDYCVRVVQGGVTKTYMLAASALTSPPLTDGASLETEAINLPAADGAVTRIELLSTPNVEDVGLPANPTVFYTWGPLMPATATFEIPPEANGPAAVTMTAEMGEVQHGYTGTVEYQFTETSGNPGATSSAWQTSRTYTDTGLQAGTTYTYTVSMRAGTNTTATSAPVSATTTPSSLASTITVNATQQFAVASGNGYKAVTGLGTFNAATADKLVVVLGMEHNNNDPCMIYGVRYNGIQMIEAVQQTGGNADGTVAIFYLDNPGAVGTGITVSGYNPNGGLGVAYALSGTQDGFGAMNSRRGSTVTSVPLTTSAANSLVIAALQNSGNNNSAGTPTANAPLTQSVGANWGSQWGSLAVGYQQVATASAVTPTFTTSTGSGYSINLAAVEFLAETVSGSTWTQTAGGAQSWTTASNWIANAVPITAAGDTVDFSTVDLAASTTLTLGANRTGGLWKFGDTAGAETWTVNAGNTITLAGTTPTIEVVNNSATLNGVVAGTAGLSKTGVGELILAGSNTYTGGTSLTNGTLTLSSATALGGGTLTIGSSANNPYLNNTSGSTITLASNTVWAGSYRLNGSWTFGDITLTANGTQEIYSTVTVSGIVSGAFNMNKQGTGNLILNGLNTYTGSNTYRQGTITVNTIKNYGVPSSLGAPATGSITLATNNSTTLAYTGTGDTTNRPVQIGGTGSAGTTATIANNGTGPLIFTAAAFNTPVGITNGSAARVVALSGSFGTTATPNEVQGVIADNTVNGATAPANRISLTKGGTGTWKISGANTYSGTTLISGSGALILGASNVLPDTTAVTIGPATLDADTRTDTAGTLDVLNAASTIRFGTGGALAFADSSEVDWTGGTLNITGSFVSGSSLRFGTSAAALTATQLSKITAAGFSSFTLNSSGYLIGNTGATFATWLTTNQPGGTFNGDHDNDGVLNGIEHFLGGSSNTTGQTPLPTITEDSGTLSITWTKSSTYPGAYGTQFWIETTDSLTGIWTIETVGINVTLSGHQITYTFPANGTRRFVRLKVVAP